MTADIDKLVYAPFVKVDEADDGSLYVYGKVADDSIDLDQQICDTGWLSEALPEWYRDWGNIREMHQPSAVGVAKDYEAADDGFYVGAKVVDAEAIKKVREQVYKGYSIGIKRAVAVADAQAKGGRIKGGRIVEVSLVDHPANETAKFTLVKRADIDKALAAQADVRKAEWDAAYINDLPDAAFAYIEAGGEKDDDGKTTPRSLRHFPHHSAGGDVDLPHLRNALARAPQSDFGDKALPHLKAHAKEEDVGEEKDKIATADAKKQEEGVSAPEETRHAQLAKQALDILKELMQLEAAEPDENSWTLRSLAEAMDALRSVLWDEVYDAASQAAGLKTADPELAKAVAEFSVKNKTYLQSLHDTASKMADVCPAIAEKEADTDMEKQAIIDTVDEHLKTALPDLVKAAIPGEGEEGLAEKVQDLEAKLEKVVTDVDEMGKRAALGGAYVGGAKPRPEEGGKDGQREIYVELAKSAEPSVRRAADEWLAAHPEAPAT